MAKLAVLKFGCGSFESGFPVTLRLSNEGEPAILELDGWLPAAPTLLELAQTWQFSYRSRGVMGNFRQLKAPKAQITRQSSSLTSVSKDWGQAINEWLNGSDRAFQPIRDQLLKAISQGEVVRLVIQAEQLELWQLPWHLWNLLQDHSNVDVTFSLNTFAAATPRSQPTHTQVKILVLLGDSTNIDIQADLKLLTTHLPDAEIYISTGVQREQLCHDLWQQSWDILFFAGHSSSQLDEGRFYLSQDVYLTIEDLRYALRRTISNGLQLAIFNSCDGLALARELAEIQLPAAIVMRERIPDEAAQKFLHYFLDTFAHTHQPLHLALREAREKLHTALNNKYPCASWLPIVYQSPISLPFSWQSLHSTEFQHPNSICSKEQLSQTEITPLLTKKRHWRIRRVLISSVIISCLVMGVRSLGWLNFPELWAYDRLMQLQPELPLDPRLLIVTVSDEDIKTFSTPLTDETIHRLLTSLTQYQPRVIGLDIFRDTPIGTGQKELLRLLQQNSRIISICGIGEEFVFPRVPQPPGVPSAQLGFADALMVDRDQIVRRYSLAMVMESHCPTEKSLAPQVIQHYLQSSTHSNTPFKQSEPLSVNGMIIPTLKAGVAGYQTIAQIGQGSKQILLRYNRSHRIAEEISLSQFLAKPYSEIIRDRIVLIGYVGNHATDVHPTPVGRMYGVRIHAHAISQMLEGASITPVFTVVEVIWVASWAMIGGFLGWCFRSPRVFWLLLSFTLGGLLITCLVLLSQNIWIPIVPAILVLLSSAQVERYFTVRLNISILKVKWEL